jgi:subtilisin-like proprotein convertase family protein
MHKHLFSILALLFLVGCNIAGKDKASTDSTPPIISPSIFRTPAVNIPSGSILGQELAAFSFTYGFSATPVALSYSVTGLPVWASFNSATGEISGSARQGLFSNIQIIKNTASGSIASAIFDIFIHGDPLFIHSWHLLNVAQTAFSITGGTSGEDINLLQTISDGHYGLGIKVLVSDTGVDPFHEDLDANVNLQTSHNYNNPGEYPQDYHGHGTAVVGIIAAEAMNNIGSRGIASSSEVSVKNFLDSAQDTATLLDQASGDFDIFNFSYGDLVYHDQQTDLDYIAQLKYGVDNLRSGKGSLYVKAAGNEFYIETPSYGGVSDPVFSHNANLPLDNESPYILLVGALNADGVRSRYSNAGSNLWIVAPGGEYEYGQVNPAIVTTDISGCSAGLSLQTTFPINSFEYNHTQNSVCNYTTTMNGTSASSPIVSGAIALMLEVNPALTWRDVKHILANTAKKVDAASGVTNHPSNIYKGITNFDLAGHTYEQGWITNAVGYDFHNWYGFGGIDVDQAVAMSKVYSENLGTQIIDQYTSAPDLAIPDYSSTGVSDTINVTGNLIIENIQLVVDVNHLSSGDLGVELTSPSGTKTILLNINNSLLLGNDSNLSNIVLMTNALYAESSTGNWTIKVIDGHNGVSGRLKSWRIKIYGRAP